MRKYEALIAVAEFGNFPKAAASLRVPLSTLRSWIAQAEREAGQRLVQRQGRGVELTETGRLMLSYAYRVVQLTREAEQAVSATRGEYLSIGTSSVFAEWLARGLLGLLERKPAVGVTLLTGHGGQVLQMLRDGLVRLAFVASPVEPSGFRVVWEAQSPIGAFVGAGFRATPGKLANVPVLLPQGVARAGFGLADRLQGRTTWYIQPVSMIKLMAMEGTALAVLPYWSVQHEVAAGRLRPVEFAAVEGLKLTANCLVDVCTQLTPSERSVLELIELAASTHKADPTAKPLRT